MTVHQSQRKVLNGVSTTSRHYYNENDPYAAAWLRNLIAAGHLPDGVVDERSIADVQPDDLEGYIQCHFFAGIGGWPLALRMAGWPDDRPVWTGSCPCQPFSGAGKQQGEKDKRHLWPEFLRLIMEWDVPAIFGEQVASSLGREWLDGVCADLEALDYRVGAADLCAAGEGAPHIRQRLYWVGVANGHGWQEGQPAAPDARHRRSTIAASDIYGLADDTGEGRRAGRRPHGGTERARNGFADNGHDGGLVDTQQPRLEGHAGDGAGCLRHVGQVQEPDRPTGTAGHAPDLWRDCIAIPCSDGKTRRTESTIFPLAHVGEWGSGSRVGLLRASGNAIVPQVAATFIEAYLDMVP